MSQPCAPTTTEPSTSNSNFNIATTTPMTMTLHYAMACHFARSYVPHNVNNGMNENYHHHFTASGSSNQVPEIELYDKPDDHPIQNNVPMEETLSPDLSTSSLLSLSSRLPLLAPMSPRLQHPQHTSLLFLLDEALRTYNYCDEGLIPKSPRSSITRQ
jgi:hypothetical protein